MNNKDDLITYKCGTKNNLLSAVFFCALFCMHRTTCFTNTHASAAFSQKRRDATLLFLERKGLNNTIEFRNVLVKEKAEVFEDTGFVKKRSSKLLPEKQSYKNSRDRERIKLRYKRQAQRVLKNRQSFEKKEQKNGKKQQTSGLIHKISGDIMEAFLEGGEEAMKRVLNSAPPLSSRDVTDLIRLLGSRRAYEEMLFILNNATSPSYIEKSPDDEASFGLSMIHMYTSSIAALAQSCEHNDKNMALQLLYNMESRGITPNSFTFTAGFLAVDGEKEALELVEYAISLDEKYHSQNNINDNENSEYLNIFVLNSAIHSCSRGDSPNGFNTAISFYRLMSKYHIKPDQKTFSSIFHCATKSILNGNQYRNKAKSDISRRYIVESVMSLLHDEMIGRYNITPSSKTWGTLISVCNVAGDSENAKLIFNSLSTTARNQMHILHYNQFLSALAKGRKKPSDTKIAYRVLQEMKNEGQVLPDIITLNTLLSIYAKYGDYKHAKELLDEMKAGSYFTTERKKNLHGSDYYSRNRHEKRIKLVPDTISYNTVLSTCSNSTEAMSLIQEMRRSDHKQQHKHDQSFTTPPLPRTSITYTNAIHSCSKSNPPDLEAAMHLFHLAMKSDDITPNVYIYSTLIWVTEKCNKHHEALRLLREMKKLGIEPNIVSYDGVISACTKKVLEKNYTGIHSLEGEEDEYLDALESAVQAYGEMKDLNIKPTTITYSNLALAINKYFSTKGLSTSKTEEFKHKSSTSRTIPRINEMKVEFLERLTSRMGSYERRLDVSGPILKSLILTYANLNQFIPAKYYFDLITPISAAYEDEHCISAILYACSAAELGRWEEAIMYIRRHADATKTDVVNPKLLNYAIITCAKADKYEEALDLIEEFGGFSSSSTGSTGKLSVVALNALISCCGRNERPDLAISLLNDMPFKFKVNPDVRSYRSVILSCQQAEERMRRDLDVIENSQDIDFDDKSEVDNNGLELHWWECSLSLLRRMKEDNITPDAKIYSSVISALQAGQQWQRAIGILDEMTDGKMIEDILDNKYAMNAVIAVCEKAGAWIEALELYEQMLLNKNVRPNFVTVNSLIIALNKAGQKELEESMYLDAIHRGIVKPWKTTFDEQKQTSLRVMDLHEFSIPMARVAVSSLMESLLNPKPAHDRNKELVIVVGKGKNSFNRHGRLGQIVQDLLQTSFDIQSEIDPSNEGRIRVSSSELIKFVERRAWRFVDEHNEE